MEYYLSIILFILSLFSADHMAHSNSIFSENATIVYPETGLFLDYVGLYKPSDTVIHNSAIFPMTTMTCHFLPISAVESIPGCNLTNNITNKRTKRSPLGVISLGVGAISLAMSAINAVKTLQLSRQVAAIERSLSKFSQTLQLHGARLAKIEENQIKLAEELHITQKALNDLIPIINSYFHIVNTLRVQIEHLETQFHRSFLYLSLSKIFQNQLNLDFLSPNDLHKVVYNVIKQGNLTFNYQHGSIPVFQIITKLLMRQQLDFVPSSQYQTKNPEEIGCLVITSFFAVPGREQTPFHVYKLLAIPFFQNNETLQLAHIPRYWAINPADNTTIEWHDPQESGCDLQFTTSCRDTPPIRTISENICLDQIVRGLPLSACQAIAVPPSTFFLRQLTNNLWVTSSPAPLYCLKIQRIDYDINIQQTWNMNE